MISVDGIDSIADVPFRDLGLKSVQATALALELSNALGVTVPVATLYNHPTITALSRALADCAPNSALVRPPSAPSEVTLQPIAVIGMACRFPGGVRGVEDYWKLLREGRDAVAPWPDSRTRLNPAFAGFPFRLGAIEGVEQFDARFFGISDLEARAMDPQQRLLLEVTWEALEEGGVVPSRIMNSNTGVFVGLGASDYGGLIRTPDAYSLTGNAVSVAAGRISYFFGLKGPSICVDTACSSSLVAFVMACDSLRRGEIEMAIVGGVTLTFDPRSTVTLANAGVLSAIGRCASFDESADGYVRGEGCGVVILKRARNVPAGTNAAALVRGYAVNHGGRGNGLAAPHGAARVQLITTALRFIRRCRGDRLRRNARDGHPHRRRGRAGRGGIDLWSGGRSSACAVDREREIEHRSPRGSIRNCRADQSDSRNPKG